MTKEEEREFGELMDYTVDTLSDSPVEEGADLHEYEKATLAAIYTYLTTEKQKTHGYALAVLFNAGVGVGVGGTAEVLSEEQESVAVREFDNDPDWGHGDH